MRKIISVCVVVFAIAGCEKSETVHAQKENRRVKWLQEDADQVVSKIQYIKDTRTGLCFAYYWGGMANGGPSLTMVPCEAVPPELLTVAK